MQDNVTPFEAIRGIEACEAAEPGPWVAYDVGFNYKVFQKGNYATIDMNSKANAQLIAMARTELPRAYQTILDLFQMLGAMVVECSALYQVMSQEELDRYPSVRRAYEANLRNLLNMESRLRELGE